MYTIWDFELFVVITVVIELNIIILYFIFWDLKVVFSSNVTNYFQVSMETIIFGLILVLFFISVPLEIPWKINFIFEQWCDFLLFGIFFVL